MQQSGGQGHGRPDEARREVWLTAVDDTLGDGGDELDRGAVRLPDAGGAEVGDGLLDHARVRHEHPDLGSVRGPRDHPVAGESPQQVRGQRVDPGAGAGRGAGRQVPPDVSGISFDRFARTARHPAGKKAVLARLSLL